MCICLITICFHMPNVFYSFVPLVFICQRWPMIGLIKVFYSTLFYSILPLSKKKDFACPLHCLCRLYARVHDYRIHDNKREKTPG